MSPEKPVYYMTESSDRQVEDNLYFSNRQSGLYKDEWVASVFIFSSMSPSVFGNLWNNWPAIVSKSILQRHQS